MDIQRKGYLAQKIVFVDGQPGCGKTLFSPIVASFDRVELLTYAYEIEHAMWLKTLGKMSDDAAQGVVQLWTDLALYNLMMARETNFRPSDLSSVFYDAHPLKYLKRLFGKGDEVVPRRITEERPILNLTVHQLLAESEPIFAALGKRAVFIEVVRHPLYMLKQQALNMERLVEDPRHFTLYVGHNNSTIPVWAYDWADLFQASNPIEKAIYAINAMTERTNKKRAYLRERYQATIITIPFEHFVLDPTVYLAAMTEALGTTMTSATTRVLKKQRVPRQKIADGLGLKIYQRCGWVPPTAGASEADELLMRRTFAADRAGAVAMKVLDQMSAEYERVYGFRKEQHA